MHMGDFTLLFDVLRLLTGQLLGAADFKGRIIAGIQHHMLLLNVGDMIRHTVEKFPIMGNQQQCSRVGAQPVLQPDHGIQIKVIGGFVEQQQVRTTHECLRQIQAHAPATGKFAGSASPCISRAARLRAW